ncbi:G patch domain-containing protein 11 [Nymphon striatum]|nr:G patch domain-containing protein 11 [Nymphon striatum]
MSSEEPGDDYMSDKLFENADVRPGLIWNRSTKRSVEISKKQKIRKKQKPMKVIENENREEGLNTALSSENKGFKLLQMMGYKPGNSLGKSENGITEPISITFKSDRGGLGRDTKILETKKKKEEEFKENLILSESARETLQNEYLSNVRNKVMTRQIKSDLFNSRKVCETLDKQKGLDGPNMKWFWPDSNNDTDTDADSEDSEDDAEVKAEVDAEELNEMEKLETLTKYLRSTHYYCIWCGTSYDDEKDLNQECPGNTADSH